MQGDQSRDSKLPVLLVTGGSRGIGAATARMAAARGYAVAINYHNASAAAEAVAASILKEGGTAATFPADVGDERAVEQMFTAIDQRLGRLAVLVNNAGISGGAAAFSEVSHDSLRAIVATNLLGAFYCIQAATARMGRSRGGAGGAIVNVSSQAGQHGGHRIAAYAATKGGINALTMGLAREVAGDGIRVNAVSPGFIDTDLNAATDPVRRQSVLAGIPLERAGTPEEVAKAILWLASDEASYITGVVLPVAGGR